MLAIVTTGSAQEAKYQLSSHILDVTQGKPATNVSIQLTKQDNNGNWAKIDEKKTDEKGVNHTGIYKLTYFTQPYFKRLKQDSFYPFIEVVFEIKDNKHYHVPITLSPFGYSTYRGN